jgi:hypothetical protein
MPSRVTVCRVARLVLGAVPASRVPAATDMCRRAVSAVVARAVRLVGGCDARELHDRAELRVVRPGERPRRAESKGRRDQQRAGER